jgi:hypothetical protein
VRGRLGWPLALTTSLAPTVVRLNRPAPEVVATFGLQLHTSTGELLRFPSSSVTFVRCSSYLAYASSTHEILRFPSSFVNFVWCSSYLAYASLASVFV